MNEIWSGLRVMETGQPSNESVHASTTYSLDARPFSPIGVLRSIVYAVVAEEKCERWADFYDTHVLVLTKFAA